MIEDDIYRLWVEKRIQNIERKLDVADNLIDGYLYQIQQDEYKQLKVWLKKPMRGMTEKTLDELK